MCKKLTKIIMSCLSRNIRMLSLLMPFAIFCLTALNSASAGNFIAMVTRGRMVVAESGETVLFDCAFHADRYNLFDYPVLWLKEQRQEEMQMNVMGNLNEPFSSTERIQVKMEVNDDGHEKLYNVLLRISNVTLKDSGNYSCEIRGPKSTALNRVTHYLFIKTAVHSIFLDKKPVIVDFPEPESSSSSSFYNNPDHYHHQHRHHNQQYQRHHQHNRHPSSPLMKLQLTELVNNLVICTALGGYPPPTLTIQRARRRPKSSTSSSSSSKPFHEHGLESTHEPLQEITSSLFPNSNRTFHVSGVPGLRDIVYRSVRWGQEIRVSREDDGALLGCTALVPGMEPVSTFVLLDVSYAPILTCKDTEASAGDENVVIKCFAASKPPPFAKFWIIDQFGTSVSEEEAKDDLRTISFTKKENEDEIQLIIPKVVTEHFRKYSLVVENVVSVSTHHAFLREKRQKGGFSIEADSYVFHNNSSQEFNFFRRKPHIVSSHGSRSSSSSSVMSSSLIFVLVILFNLTMPSSSSSSSSTRLSGNYEWIISGVVLFYQVPNCQINYIYCFLFIFYVINYMFNYIFI